MFTVHQSLIKTSTFQPALINLFIRTNYSARELTFEVLFWRKNNQSQVINRIGNL